MKRDLLREAVLLLGAALLALGIGMIYSPAGVCAAGVLLMAAAVLDGFDNDGKGGAET